MADALEAAASASHSRRKACSSSVVRNARIAANPRPLSVTVAPSTSTDTSVMYGVADGGGGTLLLPLQEALASAILRLQCFVTELVGSQDVSLEFSMS